MNDTRLGSILLENPLMRQEDLERCLEIQALTGGQRPLGEIFVDEGVITRETLDELLAVQASRRARVRDSLGHEGGDPESYLRAAAQLGASDLIMTEGRPVMVRIGGTLRALSESAVRPQDIFEFINNRLGTDAMVAMAEHKSVTRELVAPGVARGRVSAYRHFDGVAVIAHLHPEPIREARAAGLPVELSRAVSAGRGLVLVTGEVGGGLTETLNTLLLTVASEKNRFVLALDKLFEGPLPITPAVVARRRVGIDTESFASGLRAAIADAPDALFIGDVPDIEVLDLALRAAESGQLVVAALHARSVVAALERILCGYPTYDLARVRNVLAAALTCVVTLSLVPSQDGAESRLATELLVMNDAAREVVRAGTLNQLNLLMRLEGADCGHSMDDSLIALVGDQKIRFEDAFRRAEDKSRVLQQVQKR